LLLLSLSLLLVPLFAMQLVSKYSLYVFKQAAALKNTLHPRKR
jgi:hypothetical protein